MASDLRDVPGPGGYVCHSIQWLLLSLVLIDNNNSLVLNAVILHELWPNTRLWTRIVLG